MPPTQLHGARQFEAALSKLTPAIEKRFMRKHLRSGAKMILENTLRYVPVGTTKKRKTQRLNRSFTVRALKRSRVRIGYRITTKNNSRFVRTTKSGKRYFVPTILEYGSGKQNIAPHPFMRPGVDTAKSRVVAHLAAGFREGLNEWAAKTKAKTLSGR